MNNVYISLRFTFVMVILLGIIYPFSMTGLSQLLFPEKANGSLIKKEDQVIGSKLIAQNFEQAKYFWSRPSAISYNPLPSGGSNLAPTAEALKIVVAERSNKLKLNHPDQTVEPPQELLFASASGLDPHLSPEACQYQMARVAQARGFSVEKIAELIKKHTEQKTFGFLGETVVNILELNLALDKMQK